MLVASIISVTLALILYSVAVWREFYLREIRLPILIMYWGGFFFDVLGTSFMSMLSEGFALHLHTIVGVVALVLMASLGIWLSHEYGNQPYRRSRLRRTFGIAAWSLWIVVFLLGSFMR